MFVATKNMIIIILLDVLKKHADEQHPISQTKVLEIFRREYNLEVTRQTIKNNIDTLKDMGYDIQDISEGGYYLIKRDFEESELRLLIDSVLFSKTISANHAKELISKLENQASDYFKSKVSYVNSIDNYDRSDNIQTLYTVNSINDAIEDKRKIAFRYNSYGTDFKLHDKGFDYIVNPYQMIASHGHYYLLGNINKYDNISYFRIDKIKQVRVLEEKIKPMKNVKDLENGLDLPKHMAEHIYMFPGESILIKLICSIDIMDSLVDWFGKNFSILKTDKQSNEVTIRVKCNKRAMMCWALQYGPYVEVISPEELRTELAKTIKQMNKKYSN